MLSRLDEPLGREELMSLTGLPGERIDNILDFLEDKGLVVSDTPSMRPVMATIPETDYVAGAVEIENRPVEIENGPVETMTALFDREWQDDAPEAARAAAYDELRSRFATAAPEECATFIVETDGRALEILRGLSFPNRTTAILAARQNLSVPFLRNLAKFPGCPATLLAHVSRQPLVQRDSQLRGLLHRHPNMPAEAKRRGK